MRQDVLNAKDAQRQIALTSSCQCKDLGQIGKSNPTAGQSLAGNELRRGPYSGNVR